MTPFALSVLKATGYLTEEGAASEGLILPGADRLSAGDGSRIVPLLDRGGPLAADAVFKIATSPVIVFKSSEEATEFETETEWHRLAWNFGIAPLLWVTTPQYVRLYNAYQPPATYRMESPLLQEMPLSDGIDRVLQTVREVCGRRHIVTGGFWRSKLARRIDRQNRVDNVLLYELTHLLRKLVTMGIRASLAQKLVGRCIFFQYLVHRQYVTGKELKERFGAPELHQILQSLDGTYELFRWIRHTFNGDLFPLEDEEAEREQLGQTAHRLQPLVDFFGHFNVSDQQGRLFPFRFEAIPVELISSIYEKFVYMADTDGEPRVGVHYTPTNLVDLVLDPVFEGLSSTACVLDPACGSGVFLVESLRRLVWLRTREEAHTRKLVRDVLMKQVRGIDISPAALSVAAFSLYLALLELDPNPPRGIDGLDCLRFEKISDKVLFSTSTFNPGLMERVKNSGLRNDGIFDAIVGNPPWTHDPEAKEADRRLTKPSRAGVERQAENVERRSGTTYARMAGLPLPPRSTDWAFLWRARDFAHSQTRIALVMKATPFFSLERGAAQRRDRLLRGFPNVALVNLAELRLSGLFQGYEGEDGAPKTAAGPALIFFSNCLPVDRDTITAINLPWTPSFHRSGIFELPTDPSKGVPLKLIRNWPELLKAAIYGEERDLWFLERLRRNRNMTALADLVVELNLPMGQGYQPGSKYSAEHLQGLQLTSKNFRALRVARDLPTFEARRAYRAYGRERYRAPLVLMPEGGLTAALERGRYTAAFDDRDLIYNESFVGISFSGSDSRLARSLTAVMNSSLVAYQLALTGCTLGIKQTKVERVDLDIVYIPRLSDLEDEAINELLAIETKLTGVGNPIPVLAELDCLVARICGLHEDDCALLNDAVRRAQAIMFETPNDRARMDIAPRADEIKSYASRVCTTFNAYADEDDDLSLSPEDYFCSMNDLVVLRFALKPKGKMHPCVEISSLPGEGVITKIFAELFGGPELPYLKPLRSLRLYVGNNLFIAKPARYRCFSTAAALSDGDRVVADLMQSAPADPLVGAVR